jgi:hypothetical protein
VLSTPADELTLYQREQWRQRIAGVEFVSDGALPFRDTTPVRL